MPNQYVNPFEYEQATKLKTEQVLKYYIEDFNYSRFVYSRRNIFLVGERGTGKTMAFLYNSVPVRMRKAKEEGKDLDLGIIPLYVPCNTPLIHRRDHELLGALMGSLISEHFLVVSLMHAVASTLSQIPSLMSPEEESLLRADLKYLLFSDLSDSAPVLRSVEIALDRANADAQQSIISEGKSSQRLFSFVSATTGLYAPTPETRSVSIARKGTVRNPQSDRMRNEQIISLGKALEMRKIRKSRRTIRRIRSSPGPAPSIPAGEGLHRCRS